MPKVERVIFTKEMKKDYTVLIPNMLPIHMDLIRDVMCKAGFKAEVMKNNGPSVVTEGLAHTHNDICYPALLVIGQMLDELQSGRHDPDRTAFMITQTGGGCRASNYIALMRKALARAGYPQVPVISLSATGMEKNPGFELTLPQWLRVLWAVALGDFLMLIYNQCRPYEVHEGSADRALSSLKAEISAGLCGDKLISREQVHSYYNKILETFDALPKAGQGTKPRVGVVGEIYVKYSPMGNNNLEKFLISEGAEVVTPGLVDFLLYCAHNYTEDRRLYGMSAVMALLGGGAQRVLEKIQDVQIKTVESYNREKGTAFTTATHFARVRELSARYISPGVKMGEGWLLTGEMAELIDSGVNSIVCTQPFGCLPNHIVGKGMMRALKLRNPQANIVAVDYDPGASAVNQQNRIKLMLARAHAAMETAGDGGARTARRAAEAGEEKENSRKMTLRAADARARG